MVYKVEITVDGGCRHNDGSRHAYGAAAAVLHDRRTSTYQYRTARLDWGETHTSARAELLAMILALRIALDWYKGSETRPELDLTIWSDSQYAVDCMEKWVEKWGDNGWKDAYGREVVNGDLLQEAVDLDCRVWHIGSVDYIWIPREKYCLADQLCNKALDAMKDEYR